MNYYLFLHIITELQSCLQKHSRVLMKNVRQSITRLYSKAELFILK